MDRAESTRSGLDGRLYEGSALASPKRLLESSTKPVTLMLGLHDEQLLVRHGRVCGLAEQVELTDTITLRCVRAAT